MSSKGWCLTLNNYTTEEYDALSTNVDAKYFIIGKEVGESGTPHLQAYFFWSYTKRLSAVKKINVRAHWEPTKGNAQQNIDYCSKEDINPLIHGEPPVSPHQKGKIEKDRWETAFQLAKEGKLDEIDADIRWRYYRTAKEIKKDHMIEAKDHDGTTGLWLTGPAGCGKSRKARDDYPGAFKKMANKWWDGYQEQDHVLIDDLDPNHACLGHHLKIWTDRYAFPAETKGGVTNIRPKLIIVTSQFTIESIWADEETRAALRRRFKVVNMGGYEALKVRSSFQRNE